jgi:hypothetical protein
MGKELGGVARKKKEKRVTKLERFKKVAVNQGIPGRRADPLWDRVPDSRCADGVEEAGQLGCRRCGCAAAPATIYDCTAPLTSDLRSTSGKQMKLVSQTCHII